MRRHGESVCPRIRTARFKNEHTFVIAAAPRVAHNRGMIAFSKDDRHTMIGTGIVTPLILSVMLLGHLATGVAWVPEPHYRITSIFRAENWHRLTTGDWGFWCVAAGEFGLSCACLGWYYFANVTKLEWLSRPFVFVGNFGLCIATVGLVVGVIKNLFPI